MPQRAPPRNTNKDTRSDLELLVEETVRETLDEVLAPAIAAAIKKASSHLDKRITSCFAKVDELKEETDDSFAEIKKELQAVQRENNVIDTETRLKNLRINGIPEGDPVDNLKEEIRKLATTMQLDPSPILDDIDIMYRIGKPNPKKAERPRPVLIKFRSYGECDKMMKA